VTLSERAKAGHAAEAKTLGITEEQARQQGEQRIPLGRYAKPEEIAQSRIFISLDDVAVRSVHRDEQVPVT